MRPSRTASVLALAVLCVLAIATFAWVRYRPIERFHMGYVVERVPMRHSLDESYAFALRELNAVGGLPADAGLTFDGSTIREDAKSHARARDLFEWRRRGVLGGPDRIFVSVAEDPQGALFTPVLIRHWRPAWLAMLDQAIVRARAFPVTPPSVIRSSCAHGVDRAALARVLGAPPEYLPYFGVGPVRLPSLSAGAAVEATWERATTLQVYDHGASEHHGAAAFPSEIQAAFITDTPSASNTAIRLIYLYSPRPSYQKPGWQWYQFAAADFEHVCLQG